MRPARGHVSKGRWTERVRRCRLGTAAHVVAGAITLVSVPSCGGARVADTSQPRVRLDLPSDEGALVAIPQPSSPFTVIDAFGPTCEPCREKVPALLARRDELATKGARLVLVAVLGDGETTDDAAAALRSWGAPSPFLVDRGSVLARELGLKELPSSYIIDQQGRVRWSGGFGASAEDIVAAVEAAAAQ